MSSKFNSILKTTLALSLVAFTSTAIAAVDVLAIAKQKGNFTVLARAVEAAGLTQTLQGPGPITLLAPTDAAFAKLPAGALDELLLPANKDKLVNLLTGHVLAGQKTDASAMKRTRDAKTVSGSIIRFTLVRGQLRADDARVARDFYASNGVLVTIDRVLLPK